jgi:hypothetical protein
MVRPESRILHCPIERVWEFTRHRCLLNRYFENLEDVIGAH